MTLGWAVIKRPWAVLLYLLAGRTWLGSGKDNQWFWILHANFQFSSVAQSCLTLCDPMDDSMPGFPVHHQLLEPTQTPVHWWWHRWCHSTISYSVVPFSSHLQSFLASGSFPMSRFASGGQHIGVSASASVLPMNIQGWFPSGLTGWVSLQFKGLSRVFTTTVQKHQC